ncbi:hypothetical protein K2173_020461 [Erythroxylum novogranatense]|uniref:RING-type E3 ubiquitin transferase n=1 Tax=Erythroxylum novogranatense TaxID=1862640 RepID=A0AAV8TIW0_9ROSI|nr:hypothetical protein K2173_020461 [Erythroxylum novogranatense]
MSTPSPSHWCYRCSRFIRVWSQDPTTCPDCDGGFIEELHNSSQLIQTETPTRRRFTPPTMLMTGNRQSPDQNNAPTRRNRQNGGDRSPINPVIVLRGGNNNAEIGRGFELYYDDGAGSGLRPLPPSMSEFLLGSGFERLLDQLSQIEVNSFGRYEQPPASKAAIESMPTIEINEWHTSTESHCAVCKEAFELSTEAREMPCKHIYHSDCILPWLSLRNSCPVCRHELPADDEPGTSQSGRVLIENNDEEAVGLTIWRLPGGGYAVGRFTGARRGERELPVVYTEMDGGFNNGGLPRRVSWASRGGRRRESGSRVSGRLGLGRVLRHWFACFARPVGGNSRMRRAVAVEVHGGRRRL